MLSNRLFIAAAGFAALAFGSWRWPLVGEAEVANADPITVVRADPHHQGTLLAGTATAVLYRSRDSADSWTRVPFPSELRSTLHALMIDPTRANVYLAGVTSETPRFAGLFRSIDAGATWEHIPELRQKQVWSLASWASDPRVMAAGTEEGVFLTRDGGENWKRVSPPGYAGPQPVVSLAFDPAHSNILYAGTPHLPWKTVDGGSTWRSLGRGMQEDSDIFSIDVDRNQPRRLFAGACSGIYRSLDGGNSWTSLERFVGAQFRTYVVAHAPRSAHAVFAGTNAGLLLSPDGGATWRTLWGRSVRSVAFDPLNARRIFLATDEGILRSVDGGTHFTEANLGLYGRSSSFALELRDSGLASSSGDLGVRTKQ